METGIVYLIQPIEFLGTDIHKIGISIKQEGITRCKKGYGKGTVFYHIAYCAEPLIIETNIIKRFNEEFELYKGKEYFKGNITKMKKEFLKLLSEHEEEYDTEKEKNKKMNEYKDDKENEENEENKEDQNKTEKNECENDKENEEEQNKNKKKKMNGIEKIKKKKISYIKTNDIMISKMGMLYICMPCEIKPMKIKTKWIDHCNTKKHKNNLKKATHKCLKCGSCFIYDKESPENNKEFDVHMKNCKKNIIDELTEERDSDSDNDNDDHKDDYNKIIKKNKLLNIEIETKDNLIKKFQEESKYFNDIEKENIKLKEEVKSVNKSVNKLEKENKELKEENKLLNKEVKQVMSESNNKIEETKKDILKICDKQLDFAKTVSKRL